MCFWLLRKFPIYLQRISTAGNLRGFIFGTSGTELTKVSNRLQQLTNFWLGFEKSNIVAKVDNDSPRLTWIYLRRGTTNEMLNPKISQVCQRPENALIVARFSPQATECRSTAQRNVQSKRRKPRKRDKGIFFELPSQWWNSSSRSTWPFPKQPFF